MDPLPSNATKWPTLSSPSAVNFYGLFAVLGLGPEGRQPDPRHLRTLIGHSLVYGLPPVVMLFGP